MPPDLPSPVPPPPPPIDAIAIDLDGTLLGPDGQVSARNRDAVARARDAGVTVLICTGRGLAESRRALDAIDQRDPVVVAGGSIVADPVFSHTLHRAVISTQTVKAAVDIFHDHESPALVLKDPSELDYDYLVLQSERKHPLDATTSWWFNEYRLRVRTGDHVHHDEHPEHTVRVGMCAVGAVSGRAAAVVQRDLGDAVVMHDFAAVHPLDHAAEIVHILELFSPEATKWGGISWVCAQRGLDPARVAAIGDEVNDLTMIEGAGLSVAMGNAKPCITQAARYHTATNAEDGVAHAIDQILSGRWTPRSKSSSARA
jgi:5-amino-6-(5-phospho-D-ribitylamino)uracil phosphatase